MIPTSNIEAKLLTTPITNGVYSCIYTDCQDIEGLTWHKPNCGDPKHA